MAVYPVTRELANRIVRQVHAERQRLAAKALRKARATMEHGQGGESTGCALWNRKLDDWAWDNVSCTSSPVANSHVAVASLLLDGFSCTEVTNAGG